MSDAESNFTQKMLEKFANVNLSTGQTITMSSGDYEKGYESFENLITGIVDEHSKELLKTAMSDGNYDNAIKILQNEVYHILDNEITDHKAFLTWVFMIFLLKRFGYILAELEKTDPQLFKDDK